MNRMSDEEFRILVDRVSPFLFKVLAPWAMSRETAEDIVQEVWIKVHRSLHRFRGDSDIRTWIYRIAVNTAASWSRRRRDAFSDRLETVPDVRIQADPEAEAGRSSLRGAIRSAVDRLKSSERDVFLLRVWDDQSFADIARTLGSTEGSVRVRYFKVIRKLRKDLGRLQEVLDEAR
jgi:RNA polymerase sigma-70 factor (ECF subfamily)